MATDNNKGRTFLFHTGVENAYNAIIRRGADAFSTDNNHFTTTL